MAVTALPFLMFQESTAEKAINFYVAQIPGSKILDVIRYGAGEPGAEGSVEKAIFSVAGQPVLFMDGAVEHDFTVTAAVAFAVECESEQQVRSVTWALAEEGAVVVP